MQTQPTPDTPGIPDIPDTPSIWDDAKTYIRANKIDIIIVICGIIYLMLPEKHGIQTGGNAVQPSGNSIFLKVGNAVQGISSGVIRAFAVIGSFFLICGLISLPFVVYAVVFYFVVKKGFGALGKL